MKQLDRTVRRHDEADLPAPAISPGKSTLVARLARFARGTEPAQASGAPATAARAEQDLLLISHDLPSTGGAPLPGALQAKMSTAFGADFSTVQVHLDDRAGAIGAQAFASGDNLHFAPGQYDPDSQGGQELIGHELAHVVQQRAGRVAAPAQGAGLVIDDALEREADDLGARAARGEIVAAGGGGVAAAGVVQGKDAAPAAASAEQASRIVTGGDYTYEQFADGTIKIIGGPTGVGTTLPPGNKFNVAITAEIGPFPAAPQEPAAGGTAPPASPPSLSIPSLEEIVAKVGGTISELISGISDMIGGIVGAVGDLFGGTPAETAPGTAPATPSPAAPAGGPVAPEFLNQLDNDFAEGGVDGTNMCNVTSLAMQLVALRGGDAEVVKQETCDLITQHGGTPPAQAGLAGQQTEDVIMMFFDHLASKDYWQQFVAETKAPFYAGWATTDPRGKEAFDAGKFHQMGSCQAHVLSLYQGVHSENQSPISVQKKDEALKSTREFLLEVVRPQLEQGVTFSTSTRLTSAHIVLLLRVLDDGVVVHDPYGAKISNSFAKPADYLNNGKAAPTDDAKRPYLEVRFRENSELLEALRAGAGERADWGRSNYFTWEEVETYQIGRTVTSAGAA